MALTVGTQAPDFALLDTKKESVSLSSFRGKKTVLAFFPAAFTGVCQNELCTFRDQLNRFNDVGANVLAISADLPFSNGAFAEKNELNFPVLSDWSLKTIRDYGIALDNFAGIEGLTRSQRAVFVVDGEGVIQYVEVTENPGVEPNYDALMQAL